MFEDEWAWNKAMKLSLSPNPKPQQCTSPVRSQNELTGAQGNHPSILKPIPHGIISAIIPMQSHLIRPALKMRRY